MIRVQVNQLLHAMRLYPHVSKLMLILNETKLKEQQHFKWFCKLDIHQQFLSQNLGRHFTQSQ